MKNMKTNTVQLIIAGIVVVLVAICGTFAWFAVSDSARVNQIGATVVSPSIESGISEIQIYDPERGEWNSYNGDIPLSFVPGQSYSFKVLFYAADTQNVWLQLSDPHEPEYTTALEGETVAYLQDALQYRVKFNENEEPSYSNLNIDDTLGGAYLLENKPATEFSKEQQMCVCYYDLMLPGTAGNEYFNKTFEADVELIFS